MKALSLVRFWPKSLRLTNISILVVPSVTVSIAFSVAAVTRLCPQPMVDRQELFSTTRLLLLLSQTEFELRRQPHQWLSAEGAFRERIRELLNCMKVCFSIFVENWNIFLPFHTFRDSFLVFELSVIHRKMSHPKILVTKWN